MWVLTVRAAGLDHDISWYFDVKEQADMAHEMALRSDAAVVGFCEDYISDASEFFGWLVGESLEGGA